MAISRISIKDENELQKILVEDITVVETDLTAICDNMPIDSKAKIDVLCHDEDGQLVILELSAKENDNMVFEGLKTLTHVNNVKPLLKFSYKTFKIDESKTPRLIFLAPSFSEQLVNVVSQMHGIQMDLYTWEYFEFDGKRALHLEPRWLSEESQSKPKKTKPAKPKPAKPKPLEAPKKAPEKEPEPAKEVVMPPEELEPEPLGLGKAEKDRSKKKSIFSI